MDFEKLEIKELILKRELDLANELLSSQNITLDSFLDYTVGIFDKGNIVATGSLSSNSLRSIAISKEYAGTNLINMLMSHLIEKEYERGNTKLFIYTKPESVSSFKFFGFYEIARTENAVLLENTKTGLENYLKNLLNETNQLPSLHFGSKISSIVVNCNPFTNGHLYLIEKASKESDIVHLFVVWEDKSVFPNEIRYKLIIDGIKNLKNVVVHKGLDYIISSATFPTYFLKEESLAVKAHALLDITIFAKRIAPYLGINKRYVGVEPYCKVTNVYNNVMKEILPASGVELVEVDRKTIYNKDNYISASKVRNFIGNNQISSLKDYVPQTTYNFLTSKDAELIINKIKKSKTRH